jgi:predicted DNA-binding transcriptional regulator AlpA
MHSSKWAPLREDSLHGQRRKDPRVPQSKLRVDDDMWLTAAQAREFVGGVSAMCLWRWMRDPRVRFPQPVKLVGRNYWRLGDLRHWQAERAAETA